MPTLNHRIPPPLLFAVTALAMWLASPHLPHPHVGAPLRGILAGGLIGVGALPGLLAFRQFTRARTTINPVNIEAVSSLVCDGIYARTRNPMYVSLTAILFGWTFLLGSPWLIVGPGVFAAFITRFQILPEERVLERRFGLAFTAYKARVPRWL